MGEVNKHYKVYVAAFGTIGQTMDQESVPTTIIQSFVVPLISLICGSALTLAVQRFINRENHTRQVAEQRTLAAMQIATQLRTWIGAAIEVAGDISTFYSTNENFGREHSEIPNFPFDPLLDRVASLGPDNAARVFNLIHERDSLRRHIAAASEYADYEDAMRTFRAGLATLCLDAIKVHSELERQIGWKTPGIDESQIEMLNNEASFRGD